MTTSIDKPVLDLSLSAWERVQGDVTVIGTWILTTERPVLALVPTRRKRDADRISPCLIPIDMAYLWDEYTGDPVHCAQATFEFAKSLGFNEFDPINMVRLTSIIRDHLGDLLTMGPMPTTEKAVAADVIMVDRDSGKTVEAEVVDHV